MHYTSSSFFFFFNDTATTEIYTLSLHDALPIFSGGNLDHLFWLDGRRVGRNDSQRHSICSRGTRARSEEHTSELQSQSNLVCRLLLEKKKQSYQQWNADTSCSEKPPVSDLSILT